MKMYPSVFFFATGGHLDNVGGKNIYLVYSMM